MGIICLNLDCFAYWASPLLACPRISVDYFVDRGDRHPKIKSVPRTVPPFSKPIRDSKTIDPLLYETGHYLTTMKKSVIFIEDGINIKNYKVQLKRL